MILLQAFSYCTAADQRNYGPAMFADLMFLRTNKILSPATPAFKTIPGLCFPAGVATAGPDSDGVTARLSTVLNSGFNVFEAVLDANPTPASGSPPSKEKTWEAYTAEGASGDLEDEDDFN